jgi:hypothetical protein
MRFVLAMVLAGLMALPLSVSAQAGEEGATPEPSAEEAALSPEPAPEEPATPVEPAPEEPALQLKLDDAGVEVAPTPLRTPDGYTLEEMDVRVRRAKIGLGSSAAALTKEVRGICVDRHGSVGGRLRRHGCLRHSAAQAQA